MQPVSALYAIYEVTITREKKRGRKVHKKYTWLANPWSGPAKPFNAAANERYGSESALPTYIGVRTSECSK